MNPNPYQTPTNIVVNRLTPDSSQGNWLTYSWMLHGQRVQVLHREPFRLSWFATKMVTFVFVIDRQPADVRGMDEDFSALRQFASAHKRSWLPKGCQCGYALLPIYVGEGFDDGLIQSVESRHVARWCVFHSPSLFDRNSRKLHKLDQRSIWGCIYRRYLSETVEEVTELMC